MLECLYSLETLLLVILERNSYSNWRLFVAIWKETQNFNVKLGCFCMKTKAFIRTSTSVKMLQNSGRFY